MSWVIKLFSKFQVIYSHKWLSAIDTDDLLQLAMQEWRERLNGLSGEEIAHGLKNLPAGWPPTPMEFRELCQSVTAACHRPFDKSRALELKADKELAKAEKEKILLILKKGKRDE